VNGLLAAADLTKLRGPLLRRQPPVRLLPDVERRQRVVLRQPAACAGSTVGVGGLLVLGRRHARPTTSRPGWLRTATQSAHHAANAGR